MIVGRQFGDDEQLFLGTLALTIFPISCYYVFVGVGLAIPKPFNILMNLVIGFLSLLSTTSLLTCRYRDPGFIPRGQRPKELDDTTDGQNFPKYKDVILGTSVVRCTFCTTCNLYRPPRSSHCRVCDRCVSHFDHHCSWVSNCVGKRNYKSFISLLVSCCLECIIVFITCALQTLFLALRESRSGNKEHFFVSAFLECPMAPLIAFISCGVFFAVGGLLANHLWLITNNLTTHEWIRESLKLRNPYDLGCLKNWFKHCFSPEIPSIKQQTEPINNNNNNIV